MKKIFSLLLIALMALPVVAQVKRSDDFHGKYKLKEAVVLSRHNIRSPLSGHGSALGDMTPHEWTKWTAAPSELTKRGGTCETMMGQFFGDWLVDEGLFPANYTPTIDEVNIYANSMQRCIAQLSISPLALCQWPISGSTIASTHLRWIPSSSRA